MTELKSSYGIGEEVKVPMTITAVIHLEDKVVYQGITSDGGTIQFSAGALEE